MSKAHHDAKSSKNWQQTRAESPPSARYEATLPWWEKLPGEGGGPETPIPPLNQNFPRPHFQVPAARKLSSRGGWGPSCSQVRGALTAISGGLGLLPRVFGLVGCSGMECRRQARLGGGVVFVFLGGDWGLGGHVACMESAVFIRKGRWAKKRKCFGCFWKALCGGGYQKNPFPSVLCLCSALFIPRLSPSV